MRPVGARPRRAFLGARPLALLLPHAPPAGPAAAAAGALPARDAWYRPAYAREALAPAVEMAGPLAVDQEDTTTVVGPGQRMRVDARGNLIIYSATVGE